MANKVKAKKANQIIGAIAVCLGGFSMGSTIGWASPGYCILTQKSDTLTVEEFNHVSSIMCIGAATAQPFMMFYLPCVGKKWCIFSIAFPIIGLWVALALVKQFITFLVLRFLLGFCIGGYCVAAPSYVGEYSEKSIRGALGIMYQLLVVTGITSSYALGLFYSRFMSCLPMVIAPGISAIVLFFLPDSPVDLLMKNKEEKAIAALKFYRGKDYDVTEEIEELKAYVVVSGQGTFRQNMKNKADINGFITLIIFHCIQQLCGINTVLFYAGRLFEAGSFFGLSADQSVCFIGVIKILMTILVTSIVDRSGRRLLWIISLTIMAIMSIASGVYFWFYARDPEHIKNFEVVIIIFIFIYIIGFNFGCGSLPWSMVGEVLSAKTKNVCGTIVTGLNWTLAFLITASYPHLRDLLGRCTMFFIYGGLCILALPFIILLMVETKGKSLDLIQEELAEMKWCGRRAKRNDT